MQSKANKRRVLLVDDEPQVLIALEDLLGDRFIIFKAQSGEAALTILEAERDIAVIITDQRMPGMNGDELLTKVGDSADALRIMVTGYADLSAVIRSVNDGRIFAYVTKPWNGDDLLLKVDKAAEHFRLSKELTYERQLLHDLMNNIPDGIYFKDRDLRFLRVNRAYATIIGVDDPQALVGKCLEDLPRAASDVATAESDEAQILSRGVPALDVVRDYRKGSERRWVSETKAPVRSPEGDTIGLVGISRDVTERIETADALRSSEARYQKQTRILNSILDSMGEGVVVADPTGKSILFNRQAKKILGVGPRDIPPAEWADTYGAYLLDETTKLPADQNPLLLAMAGEQVPEMGMFIRNATVPGATIAVTAAPLRDDENSLMGGIAVLRDVTQQRRLEEQLAQAHKMEAVGLLAGGVAHDFNNLLVVIESYGELVLQELTEDDPKRADVREIVAAGRRASALTRQLLAFSRRQVLQPKVLDLNEVVTNVDKMLRRIIGEDIDLIIALAPGLGAIKADAGQIEQIVLNLTVNARDAMPGGGKVVIETSNVWLDEHYADSHAGVTSGPYVMLVVSDTGTGMDAATQKRIFEPFFTTKGIGRGTGLGLSTVYGIVQQSGGHIWVYSELRRGTSFKIYFARAGETAAASSPRLTKAAPANGTGTILLVEDDEAVRHITARILRDRGYTVLETRRPSEARDICAQRGTSIDLLLTDVVMPETSGPRLAEELSQAYPQLRVLYMSGYAGAALEHAGWLDTGAAYLEKPFTPGSLAEKVRAILQPSP